MGNVFIYSLLLKFIQYKIKYIQRLTAIYIRIPNMISLKRLNFIRTKYMSYAFKSKKKKKKYTHILFRQPCSASLF